MPSTTPSRTPEDVARLGSEIYERSVRSALDSEDEGKFVAIDILTENYEIDNDDFTAVMHLRNRQPNAEIWLGCIGQPAAYRMRFVE
jgi:hypothetical protein